MSAAGYELGGNKTAGVFTTDRALVIRSWDPWLAEATGLADDAACGQVLVELFPEIAERGFVLRMRRVIDQGAVEVLAPAFHRYFLPCPPRLPSAHFTRMQQHVTLSPLRSGKEVAGVVVTIEDVTERLERERELAEQLSSSDDVIRLRAAQVLAREDGSRIELARILGDRDWRVRRVAAAALAEANEVDVVSALVAAVRERHRDPGVLNAALSALIESSQDVVGPLAVLLDSEDHAVRTYAALALGQLGDARAVAPLLAALDDSDINVRYHVIEALGRLRARGAAERIVKIAQSADFFLAAPALDALAAIGEPSVAAQLLPLLENDLLQPAAAEALGHVGSEDAVLPLTALLAQRGAPVTAISDALAKIYQRLEESYGEGALVADLVRSAMTPEAGQNLLAAVPRAADEELDGLVMVLGWLDADGIDRALTRLLAHPGVRRTAAEVLVSRGQVAVDALIEALAADDDEVRRAAAMALGRIASPRAVPALVELLEAPADVAIVAAGALGSIGSHDALDPLLRLLGHESAAVRQSAVAALSSLGHTELPARIRELLADPSPLVRESAARVSGYFGYADCLQPILQLCSDPDENVRRVAVEQLALFDHPDATQEVAQALMHGHPAVRAAAARALAHMEASVAVPLLLEACTDSDPWVRYYAARAIGQHARADASTTVENLAAEDISPPVRLAAIHAMGEIGSASALPLLSRLSADLDPAIAQAAVAALGAHEHPEATKPLLDALASPDTGLQLAALLALTSRRMPHTVPVVASVARASEDAAVVAAAVTALGRIGGEPAIEILIELAREPRRYPGVVAALVGVGPRQIDLVARGLGHDDAGVRCTIVEVLARMKHPSASRHVAMALKDESEAVRLAATQALSRVDLHAPESVLSVNARAGDQESTAPAAQRAPTE